MVHKIGGKPSLLVNLEEDKSKLQSHAKQLCIHLLEDWSNLVEDDVQVGMHRWRKTPHRLNYAGRGTAGF